jgi:hypothetical protein
MIYTHASINKIDKTKIIDDPKAEIDFLTSAIEQLSTFFVSAIIK